MDKFKKIMYISLILIIVGIIIFIYVNTSKAMESDPNAKALAEIKYMEKNLVELFNLMNNIEFQNYKISSSKLETSESTEGEESQSSSSSSGGGGSESSTEKEVGSKKEEENSKRYTLEAQTILENKEDIKWDIIKNKVENIYSSIPNLTLELYQIGVEQKDVLDFNSQYDNVIKVAKEEDKQKILAQLSVLYDFIPKYIEKASNDEQEKIIIKAKNNIFKAYSILDQENWQEMSNFVKTSIEEYSKILTNMPSDDSNQYVINKGYILLNELQNAVSSQDKEVFLIKYRILLEEFNNM